MELSDIILPGEQKALDEADAKIRRTWDALILADVLNLAHESVATAEAVNRAQENLEAARAEANALVKSFTPRFVALARKNLGLSRP